LYPFYDDRKAGKKTKSAKLLALIEICSKSSQRSTAAEEVSIIGSVEPSVLQAALDDLNAFEPLPPTSWLSSLVLFVPDHSIECPYPWTSVVASGLAVTSMEAFCQQAAPALLEICKQNNRDSLHVAQVFLRQQGCVASTLLETLATCGSAQMDSKSTPAVFKTKENGFCLVCLEDEATLYTPCEGSHAECWKCRVCWSNHVKTVRPSFIFDLIISNFNFRLLIFCKVTNDTSSVEEDKISLSAFQQCLNCKGSVTEAFLDAVLESQFPEVLTAFKVSSFVS
jgi:hypothetical protein